MLLVGVLVILDLVWLGYDVVLLFEVPLFVDDCLRVDVINVHFWLNTEPWSLQLLDFFDDEKVLDIFAGGY